MNGSSWTELPGLMRSMDEPAAGPGLFPQLMVSRLAKQHVKVVLGGQGADEVFGGYTRYLVAYLEECIRGGIQGTQEDEKYVVRFDTILPNLTQLEGLRTHAALFLEGRAVRQPGPALLPAGGPRRWNCRG